MPAPTKVLLDKSYHNYLTDLSPNTKNSAQIRKWFHFRHNKLLISKCAAERDHHGTSPRCSQFSVSLHVFPTCLEPPGLCDSMRGGKLRPNQCHYIGISTTKSWCDSPTTSTQSVPASQPGGVPFDSSSAPTIKKHARCRDPRE